MTRLLRRFTRSLVPPYQSPRRPTKLVAVVVPISPLRGLDPDEKISLRHLRHYLKSYDKFLIAPKGLGLEIEGLRTMELSTRYFGSIWAHNRLLFSSQFYRRFEDYEYILIHHLDALVLRDELTQWCEAGFDYIGAPWIRCSDSPWVKEEAVGNGGFTLMRVESVLKVLHNRYRQSPRKYWEDCFAPQLRLMKTMLQRTREVAPRWLRGHMPQAARRELRSIEMAEINMRIVDFFWSFHAVKHLPEFRIPDWRTALGFAFECGPRQCLELNEGRMPFGCHAWGRYDRAFWEPHLLMESAPSPRGKTNQPA